MKKTLIFCLILALIAINTSAAFAGFEYHATLGIKANSYTYEGHRYSLLDTSNYNCGSTEGASSNNGPRQVSLNGYIKTTWSGKYEIVEALAEYGNVISPVVRYKNPGTDTITLKSLWLKGPYKGQSSSISHTVQIRSCPFLDSYRFSGEQRSCRKQIFEFSLAQNPNYPIKNINVSIDGAYLGDLEYQEDDNKEFVNGSLDFITKNKERQKFTLKLSATDSRGELIQKSIDFIVEKDLEPFAFINSENVFYRNPLTGNARIYAEALRKDGDDKAIYTWSMTDEEGKSYSGIDESLGLNMAKSYEISGLGKYNLALTVKDEWDTSSLGNLQSLIEPKDFLSSSYQKTVLVDNMAPTVKLQGSSTETKSYEANILLLNYTGDTNALKQDLADRNVVANISLANTPSKNVQAGNTENIGSFTTAFSAALSQADTTSRFWQAACYCDGTYVYRLICNIVSNKPAAPYKAIRYELADLSKDPVSITIDDPNSFAAQFINENEVKQANGGYPIYDCNGNINYTYTLKVVNTTQTQITVTRLSDGKTATKTAKSNNSKHIGYALELGDGKIVIGLGNDKTVNSKGTVKIASTMVNNTISDFCTNSSINFTSPSAYAYGFKHGDYIVLTNAYDTKSTTNVYRFNRSYDDYLQSLLTEDISCYLDQNLETITADSIVAKLGIETNSLSNGSGSTFTFEYDDYEGDSFLKAKYEYNGQSFETDSLSITINKVPGANILYFYVMDDTGNPNYNKYSRPAIVILDDAGDSGNDDDSSGGSGGSGGSGTSGGGTIDGPSNPGIENPPEIRWDNITSFFCLRRWK